MYLLLYFWYIEYCLIFLMLYGYLFIYSLLNLCWILDFKYILLVLLLLIHVTILYRYAMSIFVWLSRYFIRTNSNSLPEVPQSAYPSQLTPVSLPHLSSLSFRLYHYHPICLYIHWHITPGPPPGICAHLH